jgi:2-methylisocitrate lyase-like PEP mutase family enzyme
MMRVCPCPNVCLTLLLHAPPQMRDTMCSVGEALEATPRRIPCIGDGDTGYGNAVNARRTVAAYAQAGMAGIMIEDQVCFRFSFLIPRTV